MDKRLSVRLWLAVGSGVAIVALVLAVYAPTLLAVAGALSGYPSPMRDSASTLMPVFPTLAGGTPNPMLSAFATPSPDEKVEVVAVNELSAATMQTAPTYSFTGEYSLIDNGKRRIMKLYVTDPNSGEQIRLGDDTGSPIPGTMTAEFAIWYGSGSDLKEGLYLHRFANKTDTWVAEGVYAEQSTLKIGGRWVLYMKPSQASGIDAAELYAYNVDSGQTVLVAKDALRTTTGGGAIVNDDMVAWIGSGPSSADFTLNVYDLVGQKKWQIPTHVSNPDSAQLSVSRDLLVWRDWYWKGYDLAENALFTVPVLPSGLDQASVVSAGPVTVEGRTLHWKVNIDVQHERYFTASVAAKGQGSTPGTRGQPETTPTPLVANTSVPALAPSSYP